jgi:predicted transcriptional regulator
MKKGRKIRGWMAEHGITNSSVARSLGVSQAVVSQVIYGRTTSERIMRALIEAGVPKKLLKDAL